MRSEVSNEEQKRSGGWLTLLQLLGFLLMMVGIPVLMLAALLWAGYGIWRHWLRGTAAAPFVAILLLFAGGIILAALAKRLGRPRREAVSAPVSSPGPQDQGATRTCECKSLRQIQRQLASEATMRPHQTDQEVQRTLHDLMEALTAANAALRAGTAGALGVAAEKLVFCHRCTGLAWGKSLADSAEGGRWIGTVRNALNEDARLLMQEVARQLAAQPPSKLVRRDDAYALTCVACGTDAVSFRVEKDDVSCDSFGMNHHTAWKGERARRIAELLAEGNGRLLVDYLAPDGKGCDAYCPECAFIYCGKHLHVETEWSGSWHVATHAKCPLGHAREID